MDLRIAQTFSDARWRNIDIWHIEFTFAHGVILQMALHTMWSHFCIIEIIKEYNSVTNKVVVMFYLRNHNPWMTYINRCSSEVFTDTIIYSSSSWVDPQIFWFNSPSTHNWPAVIQFDFHISILFSPTFDSFAIHYLQDVRKPCRFVTR